MDIDRLRPECIGCLVEKQIYNYPASATVDDRIKYMQRVLKVIAEAQQSMSAPEIVDIIYRIQNDMFGKDADYAETKIYFNNLMLDIEPLMYNAIQKSDNPLKRAIQFAMTGNYIDFSIIDNVNEKELKEFLNSSKDNAVDETELQALYDDISKSNSIVYLTDNCGEIVTDKLLISVIKNIKPSVQITVVVRGEEVVNDATMEDAEQVGLTDITAVIGNGSRIAGTCLDKISHEARYVIDNADVIISKGQANFETLQQCGKNIYYIFMCKCKMFADKFSVPLYHGMLVNERNII